MQKKNLMSVAEYAIKCGISLQGVHHRKKVGLICWAETKPVILIDFLKYPPIRISLGRRPYRSA